MYSTKIKIIYCLHQTHFIKFLVHLQFVFLLLHHNSMLLHGSIIIEAIYFHNPQIIKSIEQVPFLKAYIEFVSW